MTHTPDQMSPTDPVWQQAAQEAEKQINELRLDLANVLLERDRLKQRGDALADSVRVMTESDLGTLWVWHSSAKGQWLMDARAALASWQAAPEPTWTPEQVEKMHAMGAELKAKLKPRPEAAPEQRAGWVLVPVEPTDAMLANVDEEVGGHCHSCSRWRASFDDCRRVWAAMLAAAPPAAPDHIAGASKLVSPLREVCLTRDLDGMCIVSLNGHEVIRDNGDIISHFATPDWISGYQISAPEPAPMAEKAVELPDADKLVNAYERALKDQQQGCGHWSTVESARKALVAAIQGAKQ